MEAKLHTFWCAPFQRLMSLPECVAQQAPSPGVPDSYCNNCTLAAKKHEALAIARAKEKTVQQERPDSLDLIKVEKAKNDLLRRALVGLVGSDDPEELTAMRSWLEANGLSIKTVTTQAIDALLATHDSNPGHNNHDNQEGE